MIKEVEAPSSRRGREEAGQYEQSAARAAWSDRLARIGLYALLIAGAVLFMIPLYLMFTISLKPEGEISSLWAMAAQPTLANFDKVLNDPDIYFIGKFGNTMIRALVPTFGTVLTTAMVAYPFARMRFRGRDRLFIVLLSTMMLPGVVTMIPGYMLNAKLGWVDTYWWFIVPAFFGGGAFNVFLVRQFMLGIPTELDEAAKIDGASFATIFWRVVMPNCGPVLATIAVFSFVGGFQDFMGPMLMINSPEKQMLEVALRSLQQAHKTDWGLMMAGALLVLAPIVVVFLACQRFFIRGIALTGGK